MSFLLGQLHNSSDVKEEGLDVTLDDPAVQYTQMALARWSDLSMWFIRAANYIFDRSNFELR